MSQFLTELEGDFLNDRDFKLDQDKPLLFQSDEFKQIFEVPGGFVTDFASFRLGMMQIYIAKEPATLHDYGYRTPGVMSKRTADRLFLEAMQSVGIGWWRRHVLYWAVVMFGGSSYKGGIK